MDEHLNIICLLLLLTVDLIHFSSQIYVPNEDVNQKPTRYSSGIKTRQPDVQFHHNYSRVYHQNSDSYSNKNYERSSSQSDSQETQYPIYNGHTYGQRPVPFPINERQNQVYVLNGSRIRKNENPTRRILIYNKQKRSSNIEVYRSCPRNATGQFVYESSCNQFLNCWKGRSYVQNCPPGTLFNPKSLECDFPHKVSCISGPRQSILQTERSTKSIRQVGCPKEFSGLIPNYTDCSKFINCVSGIENLMDCPKDTLFDVNKNICDFAHKATCFNGQNIYLVQQNIDGKLDFGSRNTHERQQLSYKFNEVRCPEGVDGLYRHPTDCSKFFNCANGQPYVQECSPGTLFNANLKICDFPYNVRCQNGTGSGISIIDYDAGYYDRHNSSRGSYGYSGSNIPESGYIGNTGYYGVTTDQHRTNYYQEDRNQNSGKNYYGTNYQKATSQDETNYQAITNHYGTTNQEEANYYGTKNKGKTNYYGTNNPETTNYHGTNNQGRTNYYGTSNPEATNYHGTNNNQGRPNYFGTNNQEGTNYHGTNNQDYHGSNYDGNNHRRTKQDGLNFHDTRNHDGTNNYGGSYYGNHQGTTNQDESSYQGTVNQDRTRYGTTNPHRTTNYGTTNQDGTNYYNGQYENPQRNDFEPVGHYGTNYQQSSAGRNLYDRPNYQRINQSGYHGSSVIQQRPNYDNVEGGYYQQGLNHYGSQIDRPNSYTTGHYGSNNQNTAYHGSSTNRYDSTFYDPHRQTSNQHDQTRITYIRPAYQWNGQNGQHDTTLNQGYYGHTDNTRYNQRPSEGGYQRPGIWVQPNQNTLDDITTVRNWYQSQSEEDTTSRNYDQVVNINHIRKTTTRVPFRNSYEPFYGSTSQKSNDYEDTFGTGYSNKYVRATTPKILEKNWPPPFPSTDLNADYVFEYEDNTDVTLEAENSIKDDSCGKSYFRCSANEKCIPKTLVCNGVKDCPNGQDEFKCLEYVSQFSLKKNNKLAILEKERWDNVSIATCALLCIQAQKIRCRSFNYRKIDKTCLLTDTNEGLTGALILYRPFDYYELISEQINCSSMYMCSNKKCIPRIRICDGQDDCGDRMDEKNCKPQDFGYSIRLVDSKNRNEGHIKVTAFDRTGYICDDNFGLRDANVACKELGFPLGAVEVKKNSFYGKNLTDEQRNERTFYMMDDVTCTGNETKLMDCDFSGWGVHNCQGQEIVGVVCKTPQEKCPDDYWQCDTGQECLPLAFVCDGLLDCSDNSDEGSQHCDAPTQIRLVNGTSRQEGRVEIRYHGIWGTICDDDFNEDAAKVICKQLGYTGSAFVKKDGYFGPGKGPIWLDQVFCSGNETSVENCTHWDWGEHNCDHSEDVGVVCSNSYQYERHSSIPIQHSPEEYPERCGFRNDNIFNRNDDVHFRVVKGSIARKGDYPWQAALRVKGKTFASHWCGAVIISEKFVLTAAHCLIGYSKGAYIVVAGDYNVDEDEGTEQEAYIENFYIHENFRQGHKMNNDIALIKLKGRGFRFNNNIQAICLPDKDTSYETDQNCTISGFGSIQSGKSGFFP